VHLAICKATGTQVAIKVYHRCKLSQLNNYQVHREIRIHSCLDHKNVLQLVRVCSSRRGGVGRVRCLGCTDLGCMATAVKGSNDLVTQPLLASSSSIRSRVSAASAPVA
jgi:hypothetical protein